MAELGQEQSHMKPKCSVMFHFEDHIMAYNKMPKYFNDYQIL